MANDVTSNPWILDSLGAVTADPIRVKEVRWVGSTTAGHQAVINDKNGKLKWESLAGGGNNVEESLPNIDRRIPTTWDGLTVATLGSGKLEVYYA